MIRNQDSQRHAATRLSLLNRLKNREDQKSWTDFYDTYWRLIYAMAVKAGLTPEEAEDALQETVITVAKTIDNYRYRPEVTFKGWLGHITKKRIVDQFRKRSREILANDRIAQSAASGAAIEQAPDPAGSVFDAIWENEWQRHLIELALDKLKSQVDNKQYQMFYQHVIQNQSAGTVAKTLGVNIGQVYLAKHRLAGLFKQAIDKVGTK